MTHPPRITDKSVLARWIAWKSERTTKGLYGTGKSLSLLLDEEIPRATTKNGEPYSFDRNVIAVLAERLPDELHRRLRLPDAFLHVP